MNNNKTIKHVTSVETSKKLFEHLGETDTTFHWALSSEGWLLLHESYNGFIDYNGRWFARDSFEEFYPAYTASELNELLPDYITTDKLYTLQYRRNWSKGGGLKHDLSYWFMGQVYLVSLNSPSLVEVHAEVLLHLKRHNIKYRI